MVPAPELDAATLHALLQLRVAVFVVEQACPYPEVDGRDLEPGTVHVLVRDDARVLSCLRLLDDGSPDGGPLVRVGRVCTAADGRGRGLAEAVMQRALDVIGGRESLLDAQSYLVRWYERFGYAVDGAEFLEDGIPHTPMRRPAPPG